MPGPESPHRGKKWPDRIWSEREKKDLPDEMLLYDVVDPTTVDSEASPHNVDAAGNPLFIAGPEDEVLQEEQMRLLEKALHLVEPNARHVISLRFGLDNEREHSWNEVMKEIGPTYGFKYRQQFQRVVAKAFKELKESAHPDAVALREHMHIQ